MNVEAVHDNYWRVTHADGRRWAAYFEDGVLRIRRGHVNGPLLKSGSRTWSVVHDAIFTGVGT